MLWCRPSSYHIILPSQSTPCALKSVSLSFFIPIGVKRMKCNSVFIAAPEIYCLEKIIRHPFQSVLFSLGLTVNISCTNSTYRRPPCQQTVVWFLHDHASVTSFRCHTSLTLSRFQHFMSVLNLKLSILKN